MKINLSTPLVTPLDEPVMHNNKQVTLALAIMYAMLSDRPEDVERPDAAMEKASRFELCLRVRAADGGDITLTAEDVVMIRQYAPRLPMVTCGPLLMALNEAEHV